MTPTIDIGLIGRHVFGPDLEVDDVLAPTTPWGPPSSPVTVAMIEDRRVGIVHRHGPGAELLPHQVPYAANVAALTELGATQIVGFTVVGSLSREVERGDFLLCDQYLDFTWGRQWTSVDGEEGAHADMAEPFCGRLRALATDALRSAPERVHPRATTAVINGPKFQTRAESRYYARVGADVINMTQSTEAAIAREMERCYLNVSLCTDHGVLGDELGHAGERAVASDDVVGYLAANTGRVAAVLRRVIAAVPADADCACRRALEGMRTPRRPPGSAAPAGGGSAHG